MNQLIAMTIRACVLGIKEAERTDTSPEKYIAILSKLAGELEEARPVGLSQRQPTELGQPSELEMHRADYEDVKAAGFEDPGELLAAFKSLTAQHTELGLKYEGALRLLKKHKPWTDAELRRLYDNSTEYVGPEAMDLSKASFMRLVKYIEQCHGIRPE